MRRQSDLRPAEGRPMTGGGAAALLRHLGSGVRSTREVRGYLRRRGLPEPDVERLIAASRGQGLLDDRCAARLWAEQWARAGFAAAAIRHKLRAKGFDAHAIDDAAERAALPSDDEARARLVLARHTRRASGAAARSRLTRALASRGFDPDVIERVLRESLGSTDPDAD